MLNQYPAWKYILLIVAVVMGLLYAAPNLYGEDPAVQISHRVNLINDEEVQNIKNLLQNLNIEHRSIEMGDGFIQVRRWERFSGLAAKRIRCLNFWLISTTGTCD